MTLHKHTDLRCDLRIVRHDPLGCHEKVGSALGGQTSERLNQPRLSEGHQAVEQADIGPRARHRRHGLISLRDRQGRRRFSVGASSRERCIAILHKGPSWVAMGMRRQGGTQDLVVTHCNATGSSSTLSSASFAHYVGDPTGNVHVGQNVRVRYHVVEERGVRLLLDRVMQPLLDVRRTVPSRAKACLKCPGVGR